MALTTNVGKSPMANIRIVSLRRMLIRRNRNNERGMSDVLLGKGERSILHLEKIVFVILVRYFAIDIKLAKARHAIA